MRRWQIIPALLVFLLTPWAPIVSPAQAYSGPGEPILFAASGHTLAYNFRTFYDTLNGTVVFGLPLTEVFVENGRPTQYFERARLEWRPNINQVSVAALGRWAAASREREPAFLPVQPSTSVSYFEATHHTLGGAFQKFFAQFGGQAVFGAPISEAFEEAGSSNQTPRVAQYFERARFELHPELPWPATVSLGDLGRQYLAAHPAPAAASQSVESARQALEHLRPTHVSISRIGVDVAVEERGSTMGSWDVPADDVGHFWPIAAFPGTSGNIILGGHSDFHDRIFNHLPQIQVGDEVLVTVAGQPRRYVVNELLVVLPKDTWVLQPTDKEQLTLITCFPVGVNSHRLIVHASPA